ncbi:MAG: calcium/sodium antiporter [Lachnospiraceae bacterium]|jgi:cation:H+ antiporter|nr:calcium/sodium antiporter [Lachnospiraceae bacterium]
MESVLIYVLFVAGLILIIKGGDIFVDASVWIAEAFKVPKFVIGATVVSIATTLPELLVSLMAASQGKVDVAVGNAVGSVTANIGLILGVGLLFSPFAMPKKHFTLKGLLMVASIALLFVLCLGGAMPMGLGMLLFIPLILATWDSLRAGKNEKEEAAQPVATDKWTIGANIAKFVIGTAGIVAGANLLIDNGSLIAEQWGVPEGVIAVIFIAIGTSLPELITMITAIRKKQTSLSLGNIIGANIIDITLILPVCSLVSGSALPLSARSLSMDFPICLGLALIAIIPSIFTGKFQRWQGGVLVVSYLAYAVVTFM